MNAMTSPCIALATAVLVLGGCSSGGSLTPAPTPGAPTISTAPTPPAPTQSRPTTSAQPTGPTTSKPATAPPSRPQSTVAANDPRAVLDRMSEAERVGQLFMVGAASTGTDDAATAAITSYHVGSVILMGEQRTSVSQTAAASAALQRQARRIALFVATDQEGGEVQRLRGPGFDSIPSGLAQGQIDPSALRADARRWGAQLRAAGVNVDLAPVMDTVPSAAFAAANPPIGQFDREYGYDPATVASHGAAFAQGLADAGVDATLKHFPGLGRVTGNTDTTAGVTDRTTTPDDPYLAPFARAIAAGAPFVMMSTAYYSRIDPSSPAAFSRAIVTGLLRGDLHFRGVVISDDVGGAAQVASFTPGARAVDFVAAGGDIVLTVNAALIQQMTAAVLARARADRAFRAEVDAAALRVLSAKSARGLLTP
jgi:beta-N-acetylhexosaminidase